MSISRSLITLATAGAVALGGVVVAQNASAQTATRDWGFVDISDSTTAGVGVHAGESGHTLSFTNPTKFELNCYLVGSQASLARPAFDPWTKAGISRTQAQIESDRALAQMEQAVVGTVGGRTNAALSYIAPGSTVTFQTGFQFKPGWGLFLTCRPGNSATGTVLVGYGVVQNDYSVKSSIPVIDNTIPEPPTTPPVTTTVTTTVTAEPSTVTQLVRETETVTPAPVTTTVTKEPVAQNGSSDGSVIGWIIGILVALGLGGLRDSWHRISTSQVSTSSQSR